MKNICLYFQNLFYYFSQLNIFFYGHLISRAFTFCFNYYLFNYDFGLIKLNPVVGGYFEILFSWNLKLGCHLFELVWISYYKDHKSKSKQYELQHLITNCIFDHKHGTLMSLLLPKSFMRRDCSLCSHICQTSRHLFHASFLSTWMEQSWNLKNCLSNSHFFSKSAIKSDMNCLIHVSYAQTAIRVAPVIAHKQSKTKGTIASNGICSDFSNWLLASFF